MKTAITLLFLFLTSVTNYSMAQYVFNEKIDSTNYTVSVESIIENGDSTFDVAGIVSGVGIQGIDIFVSRLNKSGKTISTMTIPTPRSEFNISISKGIDSGALISSTSYSYPIKNGDNDSIKDILVIKLDENGVEDWRKVLPAYDHYFTTVSPDSSYIVYGEWFNKYSERDKGNTNSFIIYKMNKTGTVLWYKIFGTRATDYSQDYANAGMLFCDSQSNIYFSGETDSGATNYRHGLLYKLDPKGNLLYRKFFEENKTKKEVICPQQMFNHDGKYYYNRAHEIYEFNIVTGNEKKVTNYKSQSNSFRFLANISVTNNNISAVFERDYNNEDNEMEITRLNNSFNSHWRKKIVVPDGTWSELIPIQSVSSIDNGNVFLFHEKDSSDNDYGRIVKTDCNGNYDFWRECTLGENEVELESHTIKLFPNPATTEISITIGIAEEYVIYSTIGQELRRGELDEGITTFGIADLPQGTYILRIGDSYFTKFIKD